MTRSFAWLRQGISARVPLSSKGTRTARGLGNRLRGVLAWPRRALFRLAYPVFDCIDCIGMREHGCQCAYYDAVAPGKPPRWWHIVLRFWLSHGDTTNEIAKTAIVIVFAWLVLYMVL